MKQFFFITITFLFATIVVHGQSKQVKSLRIISYTAVNKYGKVIKKDKKGHLGQDPETFLKYDRNSNLIELKKFDKQGKISFSNKKENRRW